MTTEFKWPPSVPATILITMFVGGLVLTEPGEPGTLDEVWQPPELDPLDALARSRERVRELDAALRRIRDIVDAEVFDPRSVEVFDPRDVEAFAPPPAAVPAAREAAP